MKDIIELVDLPDELILFILKKVNPRVLLLCSMTGIGNPCRENRGDFADFRNNRRKIVIHRIWYQNR